MVATYALRLRSEIDVSEATGRATFSLWYGDDPVALTIRVEPLTADQIEERRRRRRVAATHAISDGPGAPRYFRSFEAAVQHAIDEYRDAEAECFTWAWGLAERQALAR